MLDAAGHGWTGLDTWLRSAARRLFGMCAGEVPSHCQHTVGFAALEPEGLDQAQQLVGSLARFFYQAAIEENVVGSCPPLTRATIPWSSQRISPLSRSVMQNDALSSAR